MLEQEKLDNVMIEMDGTENKCKPCLHFMHHSGIQYMCTVSAPVATDCIHASCNHLCVSPS